MTRSAISLPWVKDSSISPRRTPFSFSTTHLPSPNCATPFDHHPASSPPVSRDMMRPSDPLSGHHQHQSGQERLDLVLGTQCSWHLPPSWPQLLPTPTLPTTSCHPASSRQSCRTLMKPPRCGQQVLTYPLSGPAFHHQKAWDAPKVSATADTLLKQAPDAVSHSCLLAASTKESGAWLDALPVSSLGLRMDNNTVRVAVGLRLGSPLCRPHTCHHCGVQVDGTATHGLSCKWSEGRHQCHAAVNNIVHCTMSAAHLLSRLEPTGLSRLNGVTLVGASCVRCHMSNTFAPSHLPSATREAGAVAALVQRSKQEKYAALNQHYNFTTVAIETRKPLAQKGQRLPRF